MFSYFGSKYKLAKRYGAPRFDTVVEPFAGSAAYSLFWEPKRVILIDKNPVVTSIWKYLIGASEGDIMALPIDFQHIDEVDISCGAKNLIGFWLGKGRASPVKIRSSWGEKEKDHQAAWVWGEPVKRRIASQLSKIRHWEIIEGGYTTAPDIEAHWFVDPPYIEAGKPYPIKDVKYDVLANWVGTRKGFVQCCENNDANWLPFQPFHSVNTYQSSKRDGLKKAIYSHESLHTQYNPINT